MNRNPKSPWNPKESVNVSPEEYERQVFEWINNAGAGIAGLTVTRLEKLIGLGGEYEIDCVAKFEIFEGANITVLIECKRYSKPVEREKILALNSKMHELNAQKAIMFSTSGFQSGAIKYSKSKSIALVTFIAGSWLYESRSFEGNVDPPGFLQFPKYAGIFCQYDKSLSFSQISDRYIGSMTAFFKG